MVDIPHLLFSQNRKQADLILDIIADLSEDSSRKQIIDRYKEDHPNSTGYQIPNICDHGFFKNQDISIIVLHQFKIRGGPAGLSGELLNRILDRLKDNLIISDWVGDDLIQLKPVVSIMHQSGNLRFYANGMAHIVETMKDVVPAINVKSADGDDECGSGVIIHANQKGFGIVVTNRHVVENKTIVDIIANERRFDLIASPILCDFADLAKIVVKLPDGLPTVNLAVSCEVLTSVISMGYPRVPATIDQVVMAHKGEINGKVTTLDKREYLAISCHVSPGNSGGPIFNEGGYCTGIVTQSGIGDFQDTHTKVGTYQSIYHMAVPPNVINEFLAQKRPAQK